VWHAERIGEAALLGERPKKQAVGPCMCLPDRACVPVLHLCDGRARAQTRIQFRTG